MIVIFMPMRLKSSHDILAGVYRAAKEHDWRVQLFDTMPDRFRLREILRDWDPLGCIICTGEARDVLPPHLFGNLPTAYLGDRRIGRFTVNQDHSIVAKLAVDELRECGAKSFAYIAPPIDYLWSKERFSAFKQKVDELGLTLKKFRSGSPNMQEFLKKLPKPAGVLVSADTFAAEAMVAAHKAGLSIPKDIAFVSVDNDELICENLRPTLTSIAHNFEKAGYILSNLIYEQLHNPSMAPSMRTYAPLRIVRRASTIPSKTPAEIGAALEYIRLHASEPIGVEDVAKELGLNRRALERTFKRYGNGTTIASTIRECRLNKVMDLLKRPRQSIGPIAQFCGFSSEAHLKTLFKQTYGITMREWRKINVGNQELSTSLPSR